MHTRAVIYVVKAENTFDKLRRVALTDQCQYCIQQTQMLISHIRSLAQAVEAYGDDNRRYAALRLECPVSDVTEEQAMAHYIEKGGAEGFRKRQEEAKKEQQTAQFG
ncbi:MAG: hypothetical protein A3G52_00385 [Candidatus Taylorbacteria bacterium RIFCSPLOWO2_12_FULL_43_20]|uniref:Uncharacterized protein n=1 Tax=Candidatus Taylorbacteria bacterium RIFCSPLOWO2_12_FULL_43_20 TaxID=1802332 RepID=A0A1G2P1H3_9BACT|nr:MAG: hypothetical protein A2825_01845 [Candidatus Taylorbacteria bacterium RIFCSPHIGHO2_01_FULL_43_120]OHA23317.1 MAG: hypothetical protein A3B98_03660 [Candidatus Taylorbacteria bacterium RIFCSPHIGHO2_02_FULL_43_55]OHA28939.1 MAG: hypothetical protein A3E92_04705 [Candidatus Taylorbacteria bacterium RIFCSPHIGHO2_12_FULL_42_34]OHA31446.1 MAG: hypothetical protein A3B09_03280 [Candidatus Taylorbacteria bacterium RIFCSPLOWO2_01_FULL_43_83]OHA37760.1 MAG: hypothetical protein A3H58_01245 [Candi